MTQTLDQYRRQDISKDTKDAAFIAYCLVLATGESNISNVELIILEVIGKSSVTTIKVSLGHVLVGSKQRYALV